MSWTPPRRISREPRNGLGTDAVLPSLRVTQTAATSDLRFALEAMAQMMRVNSEALRAVTAPQADWVKSLASTRGFFRNAPWFATPEPIEEEAGEEDQPTNVKTIYDVLAPLAEHWAPSVKPLVAMLAAGGGTKALGNGNDHAAPPAIDRDLAWRPTWELRDLVDLKYAAAKAQAKAESRAATPSLQERVMAEPGLMAHFMAIKALLEPDEAERILAVGERITEQEQEWLIAQVSALSAEDAAALLRTTLAELGATSSTDTHEESVQS